jgi:hypothetical protein
MTSSSHGPPSKIEEPPGAATVVMDPEEVDYEALPTTSVKVQLLAGAIAGIAEHTIIYPIDAIKVFPWFELANVDSNAGCQTESGGGVYGDYTCCLTDSLNGRSVDYVERNDKCRFRSWYALV